MTRIDCLQKVDASPEVRAIYQELENRFQMPSVRDECVHPVDDAPRVALVGSLILSEMEKLFIPAKTKG